jgi:hypothetical protein
MASASISSSASISDIVLYYNTKNNEIEYLYGQQNDIEVERIKYQIITNGKIVNTLIEDIDSSEYVVNADQDPEDEIDAEDEIWMLGWVLGWLGLFCSEVKNKLSNGNSFFANLYLANALFNKHPYTSILVKFDQNGNLVTLKGVCISPFLPVISAVFSSGVSL